ncbi:MAG: UDP-N-acetylmuramoyl-tripeptide--D-alanyl-D-alanine ligase, partial [Planctomycetes bacterium]|nr:UDP-N-acetylmuramoyl-tripeptide--D-alanyl-D-alanine ligase [Planctomycetota bacterium]
MTREEAETITGGKWQGQQREVTIYGASIDSRLVRPGCMFCCLEGERVDGHDYAATAVGDGAELV